MVKQIPIHIHSHVRTYTWTLIGLMIFVGLLAATVSPLHAAPAPPRLCQSDGGAGLDGARPDGPTAAPAYPIHLGAFLGEYGASPADAAALDAAIGNFNAATAQHHGIIADFVPWQWNAEWVPFPELKIAAILEQGATPLITWEPWDPIYPDGAVVGSASSDPTIVPGDPITPQKIVEGRYDGVIFQWARALHAVDEPILLRFAHEMNGNWYPWAGDADAYVAAWRHVHDLFEAEGVDNVIWVWSINNENVPTNNAYQDYYPGDDYVDWVSLSGYNWGNEANWTPKPACQSFIQLFGALLDELTDAYAKPLMIAEFASACDNGCGDKAAWITAAYQAMPAYPGLVAAVWFQMDKGADWRIGCCDLCSDAPAGCDDSQSAYSAVVSNPAFTGQPLAMQTFQLKPGWRQISTYVNPATPAPGALFTPLVYDRVLGDETLYDPDLPPAFNTLAAIEPGRAYVIRLSGTETGKLVVFGQRAAVSMPLALSAGWNWVGYLPAVPLEITAALQSIADRYQQVLTLDQVYWADLPDFSDLHEMRPGVGYLIYMNEAGTLVYPADSAVDMRP